jgi:ubiquinone/menaquinone biosynthesis C-methylase UbiE/DNA-binding HxlR family transcriptional regulator
MDELLVGLRAVAESTRVRILFVLSHGEFNVSELTQILGQSQPRVSRHLKLMAEAGMVSRHKEGNWVLFRLREEGLGGALSRAIVDMLPAHDASLTRDLARLDGIRAQRAELAASYFSSNAANWEKLRSLHIREEDVENAMQAIVGNAPVKTLVDLGTGTGRALEIFAPLADQAIGIDSSREMIAIARAKLERNSMRRAQVRQADLYALPFANGSTDLVVIHQVLHYLDDPARALIEARRILHDKGRLLIVDFAPHDLEVLRSEHAHRRLGISTEQITTWFNRAGLTLQRHELLPPPWLKESKGLTVSLWLAVNKTQRNPAAPQENLRQFKSETS